MSLSTPRIAAIAWEIAGPLDREDDWCATAAEALSWRLVAEGVDHILVINAVGEDGGFQYGEAINAFDCSHSWVELADGTIIDPTISQFRGVAPWPGTAHVAIVPLGHPYAARYVHAAVSS